MAAIGSLIFCTSCGNLLRESSGDANAILTCDLCGTQNRGKRLLPAWHSAAWHVP
ncbi:DNA-directed RNA polymerase I core subunit rpa12 [Ascosphaera atra]|nr:DNA-directed RNA polymerase I core subunit rpa12 [Ascosphaera atra]